MAGSESSALVFSADDQSGIRREKNNDKWIYVKDDGRIVESALVLKRIEALVIPPAWSDVWICLDPRGHLQATGRDARGRKQYRYHARWTAERDSTKFDSVQEFGGLLPKIRRRVARDLAAPGLTKPRVLAAVVSLMDRTFIRVGGERYRRDNNSFGATTLRNRHAKVRAEGIFFDFRGKSGKRHRIEVHDRRIASVVRRCLDFPGQLFQYGDLKETKSISAGDVNEYLRQVSGNTVTSKDFRTWGGTVHAALSLQRSGRADSTSGRRRQVLEAVRAASKVLGNTPAVCRRSYIHPLILTTFESGQYPVADRRTGLRRGEGLVLTLLEGQGRAPGNSAKA